MKIFISILCLVSLTFAEPPVGDGYAAARSPHDDHHHDDASNHQRSPLQEYGPPSDTSAFARNTPTGYDNNAPNDRNSLNARAQSQKHTPATVRVSFNQRFGSSAARSSARDPSTTRSLSPAAPNTRNGISQEYGPPATRSLSQEYGTPSIVSARTLSTGHVAPNARSSPSQEYDVPLAARSNQNRHSAASNLRSALPKASPGNSAPVTGTQFQTNSRSRNFAAPSARSNNIAQDFNTPKKFADTAPSSRNAPYPTHGLPTSRSQSGSSARNSNSQDSVSQTYGAPNQRDISETYGAPSTNGLSQEYGVPSSRSNQLNSAGPSSHSSASSRNSPSSTYLPVARNAMPSEQYGVPEQRDAGSQGYDLARARALEELQNQEPASYDFGYQIEDQESGSDFGHMETREEGRAQGSYFVVRPDGSKQTVEYEADERGFKPRISVEPAAGGYDDNAAEEASARTSGRPY